MGPGPPPGPCATAAPAINDAPITNTNRAAIETFIPLSPSLSLLVNPCDYLDSPSSVN